MSLNFTSRVCIFLKKTFFSQKLGLKICLGFIRLTDENKQLSKIIIKSKIITNNDAHDFLNCYLKLLPKYAKYAFVTTSKGPF